MKIWKVGDRGDAVVEIKRLLVAQGFWHPGNTSPNYTKTLADAVAYFQQTHLNEKGKPCGVDGKVGPETWWALRHPSGGPQRSGLPGGRIPRRISDARAELLDIALRQHGIKEVPDGWNRSDRPRGGVDKYLPGWCMEPDKKGPPWCCFFVWWACREHFGRFPMGERVGACRRAHQLARENRIYRSARGSYTPVPGDAFVMLYKSGGRYTGKGHIGFVYRVSRSAEEFNTVEGNCGNRVKIGKRSLSDATIEGFIDFWDDGRSLAGEFERGLVRAGDVSRSGTR
jgi:hypothetical protein